LNAFRTSAAALGDAAWRSGPAAARSGMALPTGRAERAGRGHRSADEVPPGDRGSEPGGAPHDITADQLEPEAFDLVFARKVLEHLPDPGSALRRMYAAVRQVGWLLVEDTDLASFRRISTSRRAVRVGLFQVPGGDALGRLPTKNSACNSGMNCEPWGLREYRSTAER
jgi:hypothetical protein